MKRFYHYRGKFAHDLNLILSVKMGNVNHKANLYFKNTLDGWANISHCLPDWINKQYLEPENFLLVKQMSESEFKKMLFLANL